VKPEQAYESDNAEADPPARTAAPAKALGLAAPPNLLAAADDAIERGDDG